MYREDFTVRTRTGDRGRPVVAIEYDGPRERLLDRVDSVTTAPIGPDDLELAIRPAPATKGAAVLAITGTATGAYLLETPVDHNAFEAVTTSARDRGVETVAVVIRPIEGDPVEFDTRTILLYDDAGQIRRDRSLVPGGVQP
ncbi:MAG: DUF5793 family protein [Halococcoides sp.]